VVNAINFTEIVLSKSSVDNYAIWSTGLGRLREVSTLLRPHSDYNLWLSFLSSLLSQPLAILGFDNTGPITTRLTRTLVIEASCDYGVGNARQIAVELFNNYTQDPVNSPVLADLRTAVYKTAVNELGLSAWENMFACYWNVTDSGEQNRCLGALSGARDGWLLQKSLDYSLDTSKVRAQDTVQVITGVAANPNGGQLAWDFLRDNWDLLFARYGGSISRAKSLLTGVLSGFQTQRRYDEVMDFFDGKDLGSAELALAQALERIRNNILWINQNYNPIVSFLSN